MMPQKVFLTNVGISDYKECTYRLGEREHANRLVQKAECLMLKEQGTSFDRIICVMTEESNKHNWERYWRTNQNKQVTVEDEGLRPFFEHTFPGAVLEAVDVPLASTEGELLACFQKIYAAIQAEDELWIDVTHGYRCMPMLYFPVLSYAKALKKITVKAIYYGAFDAPGDTKPILNLTMYNDIQDWADAAMGFVEYGNSGKMAELADALNDTAWNANRADANLYAKLNKISQSLDAFTIAILTARGADVGKRNNNTSIAGAYRAIPKDTLNSISSFAPLETLLQYALQSIECFACEKPDIVHTGLATVQWCLDKNLIPQGFTALEETMLTYCCLLYGASSIVSQDIREDLFGNAVSLMVGKSKQLGKTDSESSCRKSLEQSAYGQSSEYKLILRTLPAEFVTLAKDVKNARNDINHFGMRKDPQSATSFKGKLKEYLNDFRKLKDSDEFKRLPEEIERQREALKTEAGRAFVNFSNHPSEKWSQEQTKAALALENVQEIVDLPFPSVAPNANEEEIWKLANDYVEKILDQHPAAVMVQGEFGLTYAVIRALQGRQIPVLHACSERAVTESTDDSGASVRQIIFRFVCFRRYDKPKDDSKE